MSFSPDGEQLLVAKSLANSVESFDYASGDYLGHFVLPGSGDIEVVGGMTFGPNGDLFISSFLPQGVFEYNGEDGEFVGVFSSLSAPEDGSAGFDSALLFAPVCGDADSDWHVDLRDVRDFQNCYTGDGAEPSNSNCLIWFDYDRDGYIGSSDAIGFVNGFTGP
ncbi:MAG TPA: hypothetical protein VGM03_05725 [Phycisphaerae bacterium]